MVDLASGSVVRRNILANTLGGTWGVLVSLIAIPIQIWILGAEAYGLLGFVVSLQTIFGFLDFGLSTTLVREIASDSDDRQFSYELIRTASTVFWIIAGVLGLALFLASNWIASHWLRPETLTASYTAQTLRILAIWILFTWPTTLYTSILTGAQRLEVVNTLRVVTQTLTQVGGIVVVLITGDLQWFLIWLVANAALTIGLFGWACKRVLPEMLLLPGFSLLTIRRIWRFSLDINLIGILAILYTQADRLLISWLLPLSMLGYYNAALNLTRGIGTIQGFVGTAMLPALAADYSRNDQDALRRRYNKYAQSLVYVIVLPTLLFVFFGREILQLWATAEAVDAALWAFVLLAVGFFLNASMSTCYILAVASGHTRIPLRINLWGIGIYLPVLYWLVTHWGLTGAGLAWMLLNLYYLVGMLPFTQRQIMQSSSFSWLRQNFLPFITVGMGIFLAARMLGAVLKAGIISALVLGAFSAVVYTVIGFYFLAREIRYDIGRMARRALSALRVTDTYRSNS